MNKHQVKIEETFGKTQANFGLKNDHKKAH
jgi:hypothetical protein